MASHFPEQIKTLFQHTPSAQQAMRAFCKIINEKGPGVDAVLNTMRLEACAGKYDIKMPNGSQNCPSPS